MSAAAPPRGAGRPRDPAVDAAVLDATVEVLARDGYAGLTIEAVAGVAGVSKSAIYRRWPDKLAMVLDAIRAQADAEVDHLRDTGDIRADMIATLTEVGHKLVGLDGRLARSVLADIGNHPELAEAVRTELVEPRRRELHERVRRAVEAGQLPRDTDVELVAEVGQAVMFHHLVFLGEPFSDDLPRRIVAQFLPAVEG